jgi:hypothetical protein
LAWLVHTCHEKLPEAWPAESGEQSLVYLWDQAVGPTSILPLPGGGGREIIPHRFWFRFDESRAHAVSPFAMDFSMRSASNFKPQALGWASRVAPRIVLKFCARPAGISRREEGQQSQ